MERLAAKLAHPIFHPASTSFQESEAGDSSTWYPSILLRPPLPPRVLILTRDLTALQPDAKRKPLAERAIEYPSKPLPKPTSHVAAAVKGQSLSTISQVSFFSIFPSFKLVLGPLPSIGFWKNILFRTQSFPWRRPWLAKLTLLPSSSSSLLAWQHRLQSRRLQTWPRASGLVATRLWGDPSTRHPASGLLPDAPMATPNDPGPPTVIEPTGIQMMHLRAMVRLKPPYPAGVIPASPHCRTSKLRRPGLWESCQSPEKVLWSPTWLICASLATITLRSTVK